MARTEVTGKQIKDQSVDLTVDGRKIFTKGTLHAGDTLCCESEGLFISMPAEHMHLLRKGRDATTSTVPSEVTSGMVGEQPKQ